MKRKLKKKIDGKILKILNSSSAKVDFKEISDKLKLTTKKDLKVLKKKLRNLKERGKLSTKLSKYSSEKKDENMIKTGYLEIVRSYAKSFGLDMSVQELSQKAIEWQVQRGSRSGRVAKQFIVSLLSSY